MCYSLLAIEDDHSFLLLRNGSGKKKKISLVGHMFLNYNTRQAALGNQITPKEIGCLFTAPRLLQSAAHLWDDVSFRQLQIISTQLIRLLLSHFFLL